jgi:CheY-like chemotaxis protein
VLGAGDGREGLELFRTQAGSVAAVITNLVLPQINGPELIAALRVLQPGVRVIGLIGSGKSGGRPGNLDERSVAAILPKPVDVAQLLNTLRQVLGAGTDAPPPAGR